MIEQGRETLWDIGCDHGLLGLNAPERCQSLKEVVLVDPSEPVFDKLITTVNAHIPKVSFKITPQHKSGEDITVSTPNNVFVMAGMGGKTIMRILRHLREVALVDDQFVISPNRDILQVRAFLRETNWGLLQERLVEEEGQFYQQISLSKLVHGRPVSLYGEDFWQTPQGQRYKLRMLETMAVHRDPASQAFVRYLRS